MCGRYTITRPGEILDEVFENLTLPDSSTAASPPQISLPEEMLQPRYNAAPTQSLPIVHLEQGGPVVRVGRWSLTGSGGRPLINARSESVAEKPSFADSFRNRRCLIPADGFYEWRPDGNRQPFYFHRPDHRGFCFAGLWQSAREAGRPEFCIVTAAAGSWMAEVHHRRPLILDPSGYRSWIEPASDPDRLLERATATEPELARHPVDFRVNRIVNDDPTLIEAVREAPSNLSLFD